MDNNVVTPAPAEAAELPPAPVVKRAWTDHKIEILQAERLREAYEFANSNGLEVQFAQAFMGLLGLVTSFVKDADTAGRDLHAQIGYDGCKHSFRWHAVAVEPGGDHRKINRRDQGFLMNGGLIYHGRGAGETFSMTLTSGTERPWQIHT